MKPERPIKAFRKAFAEDFLRSEIEKRGLQKDFSTTSTLRRLFRELDSKGLQLSLSQRRAVLSLAIRLRRSAMAVRFLKSEATHDRPLFRTSEVDSNNHDVKAVDWRPYGINLVVNKSIFNRTYTDDLRGISRRMNITETADFLDPALVRRAAKAGFSLDDFSRLFSFSIRSRGVREHELEHTWSKAIYSPRIPVGEEIAAKFKDGRGPASTIRSLDNPPNIAEYLYLAALGFPKPGHLDFVGKAISAQSRLLKRRIDASRQGKTMKTAILGLKLSNAETRVRGLYNEIGPLLYLTPELLMAEGESHVNWIDRVKSIDRNAKLRQKVRQLGEIRRLQQRHAIPVNLLTSLLRTTPLEHIPPIIGAAVRAQKLPLKK